MQRQTTKAVKHTTKHQVSFSVKKKSRTKIFQNRDVQQIIKRTLPKEIDVGLLSPANMRDSKHGHKIIYFQMKILQRKTFDEIISCVKKGQSLLTPQNEPYSDN